MANFFKTLKKDVTAKICKYFFLGISLICTVLVVAELFTPFLDYWFIIGEDKQSLIPITSMALLQEAWAVEDGIAFFGVGVCRAVERYTNKRKQRKNHRRIGGFLLYSFLMYERRRLC